MNHKLKTLIFQSFDDIYKSCHESAGNYQSSNIPYVLYDHILEKAEWKTDTGNEMADQVANAYNKCLSVMNNNAKKECLSKNSEYIELIVIQQHINNFKKELEGLL